MSDNTATILKDEKFSSDEIFGVGSKVIGCVACGALFLWAAHPKILAPKFCPACGRRNTEAP